MVTLDVLIFGMTVLTGLLIVFLLWYFHRKIMSFFFPQNYNMITMLEADNNTQTWIQPKTKNLKFEFNGGYYNMYDKQPQNSGEDHKAQTSVYRDGRLAQFFYIEGCEDPLDFRNQTISSNPAMRKQILTVDITKLWTMGNRMKDWFLYALLGLMLGLIVGYFVGGHGKIPAPPQPAQAMAIIWMVRNARKP